MDSDRKSLTIIECFSDLVDPRVEDRCDHKLIDIIFIAVCAVISGADSFTEMEEFGKSKEAWLRQFLELRSGIPSHDTMNRVFARLKPKEFQRCFLNWVKTIAEAADKQIVPIDGKSLRRSHNRSTGRQAIELVSAWALSNRLTLGQVKVNEESNEITAVPQLLDLLELRGCIVTLDALNCQKEIATKIRKQEADYVLSLKRNHGHLFEEVERFFQSVTEDHTYGYKISTHESVDGEHGRIEVRKYWSVDVPGHLSSKQEWADLQSLLMVEATREIKGEVSKEARYYLSSLEVDAVGLSEAVRGHWGIENSCHWVLDVAFREDDCRVRVGHAAENFALVRRVALNLLAKDKSVKRGIKTKRYKAALEEDYLLRILNT